MYSAGCFCLPFPPEEIEYVSRRIPRRITFSRFSFSLVQGHKIYSMQEQQMFLGKMAEDAASRWQVPLLKNGAGTSRGWCLRISSGLFIVLNPVREWWQKRFLAHQQGQV